MKAEIVALGETHHGLHNDAIRKFLASAPQFKGIFREEAQDYQESVNTYLSTGKLDSEFEGLFERSVARGSPPSIRERDIMLLDYARRNKLPVICVDSSKVQTEKYNKKSPFGYWFIAGESRDEDMFNSIKEHLKEGERWLFIGGYEHLKEGPHFRTGLRTLGDQLKEYLGDGYKFIVLK